MPSLAKKSRPVISTPPAKPCLVKPIKSWLVGHYWDFVCPFVESALEHANGELTGDDIREYLLTERMYLFVAQRPLICGAATCEVVQYARKRAIRVVTVAGENFDDWRKPLQEELVKWGRRIKADGIEAYVRPGLVPQLEGLGYRRVYVGVFYDIGRDHGKEVGDADS